MVRVEEDLAERGRETIEKNKEIDHKRRAVETQFNPRNGNILFPDIDTANNEMGGIPLRVDNGYQSGLIRQTIG